LRGFLVRGRGIYMQMPLRNNRKYVIAISKL